jgi:predicted dehydrogenase
MIRVGILGCGGIAKKHASAILAMKDQLELAACCDIDAARAGAFAQEYTQGSAQVFSDHRKMYDTARLDLAVICLPPFAHTDEVGLAAQCGIHLLVEKPIALEHELAWRMVEQAEQAKIKTQVGFMYRFGAAVELLRQKQAAGETGRPGLFSASYACNSLHAPWWREREKSGGQLVEQIIHLFDLMRFLVGEPVRVFSRQANLFHQATPGYTSEDASATIVTFSGGALGVIYASNGAVPNQWNKEWRLVSERMVAEFADWNHARLIPTAPGAGEPEIVSADGDVFQAQLRDLVQAIQTGGETRTPLREGARSLDLVLAARRSSESGAEVEL